MADDAGIEPELLDCDEIENETGGARGSHFHTAN